MRQVRQHSERGMRKHRLCVLGGTGFIGRHLISRLARQGHYLRVLTRRRERHRELLVMPTLELVESNIHRVSELSARFKGCDAVINLVGALNDGPTSSESLEAVHAQLPGKVVEACQFNGIRRYLHMSALNADPEGPSQYLRTKGVGENQVHAAIRDGMEVTSFRPSVVFGHDDSFFNRFAGLLSLSPVLPLACPETRFAPVYVGDVADAFMQALDDRATYGQRYDLCGPHTYTLRELVAYTAKSMGARRLVIGLGDGASRLQARLMEWVPGKPFTRDNYLSMQVDSVCRSDGLAALGIEPTSVDAVMPVHLQARSRAVWLNGLRTLAGRG